MSGMVHIGLPRPARRAVTCLAIAMFALVMATPAWSATPRIIGGLPAAIQAYPWTVALVTADGFAFCGGALVAPAEVVTAAHCLRGRDPKQLRVVAGRTNLLQPGGQVARIDRMLLYPGFTEPERGGDAAVVMLSSPLRAVPLPLVRPVDGRLYAPGTVATVVGWGRIADGGGTSTNQLRAARVPLLPDKVCRSAYPGHFDSRTMVCAGYPRGGVDACQGDSGGPLMAGGKLIGLVSWGQGCARPGRPGVYTRVAAFFFPHAQWLAPGGVAVAALP